MIKNYDHIISLVSDMHDASNNLNDGAYDRKTAMRLRYLMMRAEQLIVAVGAAKRNLELENENERDFDAR